MWTRFVRPAGYLAGLGILGLFIALLAQQVPYMRQLIAPRLDVFVALMGLGLLVFFFRALMNRAVFSPLGVNISTLQWLGIVVAGTIANLLPFIAGTVAKGLYLNRIHQLPYRTYAGGQVALFALVLCCNGLMGLVLLGAVFNDRASPAVWALFGVMACAGLILFFPETLRRLVGEARFPWPTWSWRQRAVAWIGGGIGQMCILLLLALRLDLCFAMGLESVSFFACLLFSASTAITRIASITPASIGTREFMIGGIAYLCGFEFRDALLASTIDRFADFLLIGLLAPFFASYLKREISGTRSGVSGNNGADDPQAH